MSKEIKIGQNVYNNFDFLKELSRIRSEKTRAELIKGASCDELLSVVEICLNILKSSVCLSREQRRKLKPFANYVRRLARVRSEQGARRVVQEGSGPLFAALLSPILIEAAKLITSRFNDSS